MKGAMLKAEMVKFEEQQEAARQAPATMRAKASVKVDANMTARAKTIQLRGSFWLRHSGGSP